MKIIVLIVLLFFVIALYYLYNTNVHEGFLSGTDVQLLTSKPYYTWYDYLRNWRRRPYVYRYPHYRYFPNYYNYGFNPFYKPIYY